MKILWAILSLLVMTNVDAATSLWQDIQARGSATPTTAGLQHYRLLHLNETEWLAQLAQTASANTQARGASPSLELPLPDGGFASVTVTPTEVLAPDIAATHPDIGTWKVFGTDGKVISGVLDFTPAGLHAMLDMANGDTLFIDPQTNGTAREYLSFRKSANSEAFRHGDWSCTTHQQPTVPSFASAVSANTAARSLAARAGETLHTYRIAMAATAEYTNFHGGQSAAFSAIVTTVNRLNQIYERDLSTRLTLVSGTNVVYTNARTDPYSNSSPLLLLTENTSVINQAIGVNNYDIGHVLATFGGGLASVGVACGEFKAEGTTGLPEPVGDSFIIDYVAHEIGHQVGASHTFNGTRGACAGNNRQKETAYEPGSGSTIMAYTGLCGGDDLQLDSDAMMHSASIQQIQDYLHNGAGASCATKTSLSNRLPTADAGSDYTIPAATPFILKGSGADADTANTLSYSWEQLDAGSAAFVNVDLGDNALMRAHLPTNLPERTIPQMSDLVGRVQSAGEVLPVTSRFLNFRLLVRDARGGIGTDNTVIRVQNTGSAFAITEPSGTNLVRGGLQNVAWNVAATNQAPINCSAVDIAVSADNGNTFATLLSNTPNDGNATVTLPTTLGNTTYLRVKCSNNIFFALSATNPAQARTSNDASSTLSVAPNVLSSGGGGSLPYAGLLLLGFYALLRAHRGTRR
ncbi:MAG: M12 family metallo-peptidase [Candidatus Thiothrix sulfatifontis]|nr:MAG: M12 family metallo-peptidase [Candidatus Thiothrix sulfatifontis]